MNDLIKKQDIFKIIKDRFPNNYDDSIQYHEGYVDALNDIGIAVSYLPSAEPEIIRCKDCVKCGFCGDETNLEIMGFYGFCSRAERRTDE